MKLVQQWFASELCVNQDLALLAWLLGGLDGQVDVLELELLSNVGRESPRLHPAQHSLNQDLLLILAQGVILPAQPESLQPDSLEDQINR